MDVRPISAPIAVASLNILRIVEAVEQKNVNIGFSIAELTEGINFCILAASEMIQSCLTE
jgi:hypothetical protein